MLKGLGQDWWRSCAVIHSPPWHACSPCSHLKGDIKQLWEQNKASPVPSEHAGAWWTVMEETTFHCLSWIGTGSQPKQWRDKLPSATDPTFYSLVGRALVWVVLVLKPSVAALTWMIPSIDRGYPGVCPSLSHRSRTRSSLKLLLLYPDLLNRKKKGLAMNG